MKIIYIYFPGKLFLVETLSPKLFVVSMNIFFFSKRIKYNSKNKVFWVFVFSLSFSSRIDCNIFFFSFLLFPKKQTEVAFTLFLVFLYLLRIDIASFTGLGDKNNNQS